MTAIAAQRRLATAALLLMLLLGLMAECDDGGWDDGVIRASATTGAVR